MSEENTEPTPGEHVTPDWDRLFGPIVRETSQLFDAAVAMHEMYTVLQQGGFTPQEALSIVIAGIRGQG